MGKRVIVIGAGYAGLSTAALLADRGHEVTVLEKNEGPGGRGRGWSSGGYSFDMGPSWYLMPEVFDRFFGLLGARREDYWGLTKLSTYYQVFFGDGSKVTIDDDFEKTRASFESLEPGAAGKLDAYLKGAKYKYETAMGEFLYRDYENIFQFFNRRLVVEGLKLGVFSKLDNFVKKTFRDERTRQLLEYSMVFLGSSPSNAPALYSLLAHVDLGLGVWFPKGGMVSVATGLEKAARDRGVAFAYDSPATAIVADKGRVVAVRSAAGELPADLVVATADYAHVELGLLDAAHRSYPDSFWRRATVAPSMLVGFLGTKGRVPGLEHHNLHFATNWDEHFRTIFGRPSWPMDPCWYLSATTRTEPSMAPAGGDSLYLLVPVAAGLADRDEAREALFDRSMEKLEGFVGSPIRGDLAVKRLYAHRDFAKDYNALGGSALGLSHTLFQTAIFRPRRRSKKLKGLYYAGQYTHPGIGVPMALIAAELAARAIGEDLA